MNLRVTVHINKFEAPTYVARASQIVDFDPALLNHSKAAIFIEGRLAEINIIQIYDFGDIHLHLDLNTTELDCVLLLESLDAHGWATEKFSAARF